MKTLLDTLRRASVGALLGASTLAVAIVFTPAAQAQAPSKTAQALHSAVRFPAGLHWEVMGRVSFGYKPKAYGTPAERGLAKQLWQKELSAPGFNNPAQTFPAFILLSGFRDGANRYYFTALSAAASAYPACEPPPNGGDASTPTYDTCPMRVIVENTSTKERTQQDFPKYCIQFGYDEPDSPVAQNHTEIALDSKTRTAYFRVFQYGKPVPQCNRAINLQG